MPWMNARTRFTQDFPGTFGLRAELSFLFLVAFWSLWFAVLFSISIHPYCVIRSLCAHVSYVSAFCGVKQRVVATMSTKMSNTKMAVAVAATGVLLFSLYKTYEKMSASRTKKFVCGDGAADCACNNMPQSCQQAGGPKKITVAPGETKWICQCGQSASGLCNGSHNAYNKAHGTKYAPKPIKNEESGEKDFWLCTCGHSKKMPCCDGTHKAVKANLATAP
eukprot:g71501.t1